MHEISKELATVVGIILAIILTAVIIRAQIWKSKQDDRLRDFRNRKS